MAQTMPQGGVTKPNDSAALEGRLVQRAVEQLRAHPVYLKVCGSLAAARISNDQLDSTPIIEPLLITRDGLILDGHERWAVARHQGRKALPCIEYDLSEEQALTFMLHKHRRSERINDFCRIVMALALEPHLRERARERQRQGGKMKLSSNLTKDHAIDVRAELARAAGVSAGNVTNVKRLLETITPEVHEALRCGKVKIYKAWKWHRLPKKRQNEELNKHLNGKSIKQAIDSTIEYLLRKHEDGQDNGLSIERFADRLAHAAREGLRNVKLLLSDLPGPAVVVTRDLYDQLMGEKRL